MRNKRIVHGAAALLLGTLAALARAEPGEHVHLEVQEGLDFSAMLQAALERAPQALETPVRAQQARGMQAAGNSLVAGRPSVIYNLIDDRWRDNTGLRQQDVGVQLPLWRPGERRQARALGENYQAQVTLWSTYLHWELAGRLRAALNELEAAQAGLELEREAGSAAEELHRITQRLFEAGSLAQLDTLQTRTLLLEQQQRILETEARMVDAERTIFILTGLDRRPAEPFSETLSGEDDIPDNHPLLRLLQSEVAIAQGNVAQSALDAKGSPQLTLGSHSERGDRFQPSNDSVMLSVSIPIGGRQLVDSRTSSARREQVDAEVELRRNRIELQRLLAEAEHGLFINEQALPLAQEQNTLAEQRRAMAESAFEGGELTLAQVLAAVQDAIGARQALRRLQLERDRLVSEYNQLIGVLP
ncbi:MAG TPA: TolC family protein [Hyphomicrobiales bacterium]|nr:TolC family protein [Hyphomicrobiales bacterium]